jgi:S-adenosylmethionine-diacylgycerolhomoserine-N-methlytransferase
MSKVETGTSAPTETHADLMDGMYRYQRHIYDLTRKYYLLGRDQTIRDLDLAPSATLLEVGCGTGRNLALAHKQFPRARLYGLDISQEMLISARRTFAALGTPADFRVADATAFTAQEFGVKQVSTAS